MNRIRRKEVKNEILEVLDNVYEAAEDADYKCYLKLMKIIKEEISYSYNNGKYSGYLQGRNVEDEIVLKDFQSWFNGWTQDKYHISNEEINNYLKTKEK